jgi:hypothetical protein
MTEKIKLSTGEVLSLPRGHLSPSQLEMYLKCPMQYYWRHVEGRTDPPGIAQVAGLSGHKGVEVNNRHKQEHGEDLPASVVVECFSDHLSDTSKEIEDWEGETLDGTIKAVAPTLMNYMEDVAPPIQPVAVEQPFIIDIEGLPVVGFIDLQTSKGLVVDYKFPKSRGSPFLKQYTVDTSPQLSTYAMATGKKRVGYVLMLREQVLKTKTNPAEARQMKSARKAGDLKYTRELYLQVARSISAGAFPLCSPMNFLCSSKYCGYWNRCRGKLLKNQKIIRGGKGARNAK